MKRLHKSRQVINANIQGLMIHCDITTGNNTLASTELDHTNQAVSKYTSDGKQKYVTTKLKSFVYLFGEGK